VGELLLRLTRESNAITAAPEIDTVVLLDRGVDLVSPCLTQVCVCVCVCVFVCVCVLCVCLCVC
jgi:hypothetical protein